MSLFHSLSHLRTTDGFEHIVNLPQLDELQIDGFFDDFEDLSPAVARSQNMQAKLGYLRERLEESAEPLLAVAS